MSALAQHAAIDRVGALIGIVEKRLAGQPFWQQRLERIREGSSRLHLAILHEPFLSLILDGTKTVESRFSVNRVAPYGAVSANDLVLLKRTSGPIVGLALAGPPGFYELDTVAWSTIRARFARAICAPDQRFWDDRAQARYATLIPIRARLQIEPLDIAKRDRRGWALLPLPEQLPLPNQALFG